MAEEGRRIVDVAVPRPRRGADRLPPCPASGSRLRGSAPVRLSPFSYRPSALIIVSPSSDGLSATWIPALFIASIFAAAVSLPPVITAPA